MDGQEGLIQLAADLVTAYVAHNQLGAAELPALIQQTYAALASTGAGPNEVAAESPKPAISIKKSVTQDHITCLEDGRQFKSLKRHLRTDHNLSPQEYRARWNLPRDYPMVAPDYSEARSNMALKAGLGQKRAKGKARNRKAA